VANCSVFIKPSAAKELEGLPDKDRRRIARRIQGLAADPRPPGREKLTGDDRFRVRHGDYRVVYAVDDRAREVVVVKIGNRRDVYR
jgi:mRNA interferase RelE/StbE